MKITHDCESREFLLLDELGNIMGEISYTEGADNTLYATHTGVRAAYEGQGYAERLLDALCEYAMNNDKKIIPVCSYVAGAFKKYPDKYAPVMK